MACTSEQMIYCPERDQSLSVNFGNPPYHWNGLSCAPQLPYANLLYHRLGFIWKISVALVILF